MKKSEMLHRLESGALLLIAFLLPFEFNNLALTSICIVAFIIIRMAGAVSLWEGIKANIRIILGLSALYFMYLIGITYTGNMELGLFSLQVKLSMILFPVFLISRKTSQDERNRILLSFILGCLLSALLCLLSSCYDWYSANDPHFFYERFSIFLHPGYFAMYLNFAVLALLLSVSGYFSLPFMNRITSILLALFFSVIIILLSSKSGVIFLCLIGLLYMPYEILRGKNRRVGFIVFLAAMLLLASALIFLPGVNSRFASTWKSVTAKNLDKTSPESNNIRMLIWQAGSRIIKEHFLFGVGTGDARQELYAEYQKEGITGAYLKDKDSSNVNILNAHNQFLQTFIAIGFVGFILLLTVFFIACRDSFRNGNPLLFALILLCAISFLTESMLERQAGVIFYAFFNALLIHQPGSGHEQNQ
jgi:O-antigen ligase